MNSTNNLTSSTIKFVPKDTAIAFAKQTTDKLALNNEYHLDIQITNYPLTIQNYYQENLGMEPIALCQKAEIPYAFGFANFGLVISFTSPTELMLHDLEMRLSSEIKSLIQQFGVVILKNAFLSPAIRDLCHLNNFAHLNFHRDRHDIHENRYSLYTRNPFSPEQYQPRTASTLFIDNSVAYLQAYRENLLNQNETGRRGHYEIFKHTNLPPLFNNLILNQAWDSPAGTGEIAVINNNTVLHSSYKHTIEKGYSIGARYLF